MFLNEAFFNYLWQIQGKRQIKGIIKNWKQKFYFEEFENVGYINFSTSLDLLFFEKGKKILK